MVAAATGRPLTVQRVSDEAMRQSLRSAGLGEVWVEAVMGMSVGTRDFAPEQSRDVTTTTPTTLASWAYGVLRPLL